MESRSAAFTHEQLRAAAEAQTVSATGRPNRWRQLGAEAVERHGEALRKLAES